MEWGLWKGLRPGEVDSQHPPTVGLPAYCLGAQESNQVFKEAVLCPRQQPQSRRRDNFSEGGCAHGSPPLCRHPPTMDLHVRPPPGYGSFVQFSTAGGSKNSLRVTPISGLFFIFPFHSEHFKYTKRGIPFTTSGNTIGHSSTNESARAPSGSSVQRVAFANPLVPSGVGWGFWGDAVCMCVCCGGLGGWGIWPRPLCWWCPTKGAPHQRSSHWHRKDCRPLTKA